MAISEEEIKDLRRRKHLYVLFAILMAAMGGLDLIMGMDSGSAATAIVMVFLCLCCWICSAGWFCRARTVYVKKILAEEIAAYVDDVEDRFVQHEMEPDGQDSRKSPENV